MPESEIFSNPDRLMSLSAELRMFTNNLRLELEKMNDGLRLLGSTWKDEAFEKFSRSFYQLSEGLKKLDSEISQREGELQQDAQLLRDALKYEQNF